MEGGNDLFLSNYSPCLHLCTQTNISFSLFNYSNDKNRIRFIVKMVSVTYVPQVDLYNPVLIFSNSNVSLTEKNLSLSKY